MRILAVSHTPVWPVRSGAAVRRSMVLEALSSLGSVDLLFVGEVSGAARSIPTNAPIVRAWELEAEKIRPSVWQRLLWLVRLGEPIETIEWDLRDLARQSMTEYDVVWYFRPVAYALAGRIDATTRVVDLDDLEDHKIDLSLASGSAGRYPTMRRFVKRLNGIAWRRYQKTIATDVEHIVVCSEADKLRLGIRNAHVVPNGFPDVGFEAQSPLGPPVLLFVGSFDYEPNADAAEWFVSSIFPHILRRFPDCKVRMVGKATSRIRALSRPGVVIAGEVDDLVQEFAGSTLSIAPIRVGSGTRIKVLESFARGVPVVSTRIGAAGLEVRNREHLLLEDTPVGFAAACCDVLADQSLGAALGRAGRAVFEARYSRDSVRQAVEQVFRSTVSE